MRTTMLTKFAKSCMKNNLCTRHDPSFQTDKNRLVYVRLFETGLGFLYFFR